ncbi:MAG: GNAT family N-acetyltransferase [Rhodobacteraceae bacterium]|nr:GNAT family N-acetyltransferase [Paracoccaceae bacterium]
MTAAALALTHKRAMATRPWSTDEFSALLQAPGVFLIGDATCFALGRLAADEAELLTLATDPDFRRRGLARKALNAFHATARDRGATAAFLEVAHDNTAAIALYLGCGWVEVGRRAGYYENDGAAIDAIVMRRDLTPRQDAQPG